MTLKQIKRMVTKQYKASTSWRRLTLDSADENHAEVAVGEHLGSVRHTVVDLLYPERHHLLSQRKGRCQFMFSLSLLIPPSQSPS